MKMGLLVLAMSLIFATTTPAADSDSPRPGTYKIYVIDTNSHSKYTKYLYNGYFVLAADGSYKAYLPGDKLSGEGKYAYDAAKKTITWTTGPYAGVWDGDFTTQNEGKTHRVNMKPNTFATNQEETATK